MLKTVLTLLMFGLLSSCGGADSITADEEIIGVSLPMAYLFEDYQPDISKKQAQKLRDIGIKVVARDCFSGLRYDKYSPGNGSFTFYGDQYAWTTRFYIPKSQLHLALSAGFQKSTNLIEDDITFLSGLQEGLCDQYQIEPDSSLDKLFHVSVHRLAFVKGQTDVAKVAGIQLERLHQSGIMPLLHECVVNNPDKESSFNVRFLVRKDEYEQAIKLGFESSTMVMAVNNRPKDPKYEHTFSYTDCKNIK